MTIVSRTISTALAAAAIGIALTGCGAIGSAVDCASVADTMADVSNNVTGDVETLKQSTDKLRDEAADIEDKGLKQAALDFADQAESVNAGLNGDVSEGAETDPGVLTDSLDSFTSECNALG